MDAKFTIVLKALFIQVRPSVSESRYLSHASHRLLRRGPAMSDDGGAEQLSRLFVGRASQRLAHLHKTF